MNDTYVISPESSRNNGKKRGRLVVIIPMYNEERVAQNCINRVISVIRKLNHPVKLLVVNDGSRDKTKEIITRLQKKYKKYLMVISYDKNRGYGGAIKEGIRMAGKNGFEYGLFMDSDLTNNPKYIKDFVGATEYGYDLVKASRYIKGGGMIGVPLKRRFISALGNIIARNIFQMGIRDCTNGFRMVRLSMLKNVRFQEESFAIILEELYILKKKGAKAVEIPNDLTSRRNNLSKFQYNFSTFQSYLKYCAKSLLE